MADVERSDNNPAKKAADEDSSDVALITVSPEEERRIVRKVDWAVLPILCGFYFFQAIDKGNLGLAKLSGIQTDTGTDGTLFNVAVSMFFIGYGICAVPITLAVAKFNPRLLISFIGFAWGLAVLLMAFAKNPAGLFAARFFLGVFEAGILPLSMFITSIWYPRKEHALKTAIWFSCSSIGSTCAGLISYGIQKNLTSGFLKPWGYLFFIEGGFTMAWGILAFFITPDIPERATFLTAEEKLVIAHRLEADRSQNKVAFNRAQFKEAFLDIKIWILALVYFTWQAVNTAFSFFGPQIIQALGASNLNAQLLNSPFAAFNFVIQVVISWSSDRTGDRSLHLVVAGLLSIVGYLCVIFAYPTSGDNVGFWRGYVLLFFTSFNPGSLTVIIGWTTNIFAGSTKRIVTSSIIAIAGAFAGAVGSYIYEDSDKPKYRVGHSSAMILIIVGIVAAFALRWVLVRENRKRDELYGKAKIHLAKDVDEAFSQEFTDKDPNYRYVY
ncbi:major facilitator superfamily domain-containing protein [Zopfochytrium polystomum]|nr:major facilitator superfamily domain-containing protein [Zopfochytrium polystomum]